MTKRRPLTLTWGSDPELMIQDTKTQRIVSAIPVIKRDKHDPVDLGNGAKMYYDNVLTEMSFSPARLEEITARFKDAFARMKKHLGPQYRLFPKAAHVYDAKEVESDIAMQAGCDPSFNAWTRSVNPATKFTTGLRSGSCHIHVGREDWENPADERLVAIESKEQAVRLMDVFVGCANVIFDKDPTAPERRKLYGRSSECRWPPHGVEYRVCGPYMLKSPELIQLGYDLAFHAVSHVVDDTAEQALARIKPEEVQTAINTNDAKLARKVLVAAGLPKALMQRVEKDYRLPEFEKAWGI